MRRKPRPYRKFGDLLTEGIKILALARRQPHGQTHEQLAHELGVAPTTLYSWRRGEHPPESQLIPRLARIFAQEGSVDQRWISDFLAAAGYGPVHAVEALMYELFGPDGRRAGGTGRPGEGRADRGAKDWTEDIFALLIHWQDRVTARDFLKIAGGLTIWLGGWWLFRPFLAWPFPNEQAALSACVKYSIASLVLPLLVCLLHSLSDQDMVKLPDQKERRKLWGLRCAAAYVGYHLAMAVYLGAAVLLYSARVWPLPAWLRSAALALVLLFAYAAARQVPARRITAGTGRLTYYPLDNVVLAVFVGFGPLTAAFFYFAYPWLLQPYVGGFILLAGIALTAITPTLQKKPGKT